MSQEPLFFSLVGGRAIYNRAPTEEEFQRFYAMGIQSLTMQGNGLDAAAFVRTLTFVSELGKAAASQNEKAESERDASLLALEEANRWGRLAMSYEPILKTGNRNNDVPQ